MRNDYSSTAYVFFSKDFDFKIESCLQPEFSDFPSSVRIESAPFWSRFRWFSFIRGTPVKKTFWQYCIWRGGKAYLGGLRHGYWPWESRWVMVSHQYSLGKKVTFAHALLPINAIIIRGAKEFLSIDKWLDKLGFVILLEYILSRKSEVNTQRGYLLATHYCSVLLKWEFFMKMRAACLQPSSHQNTSFLEVRWCKTGMQLSL